MLHISRGMAPFDLIERTRAFALDVRALCARLPRTSEAHEAASQLRRAANSTHSNYRAARKSRSHAEFTSKLQTAFEEADESLDWLQYLRDSKICEDKSLLSEAHELSSILGAAVKTARRNRNDGRDHRQVP